MSSTRTAVMVVMAFSGLFGVDGALVLFAQAADKAKSTKYADMEKSMRGGSFDTVIGTLSFDAKGDNKLPGFKVYQWKGNQYDYVK